MILLILLLAPFWALILTNELQPWLSLKEKIGLGKERKLISNYAILDYCFFLIWKVLGCPNCLAYHLAWISIWIVCGTPIGLFLGVISYYLVNKYYDWFIKIKI
jgi:hypothetical protein